MSKMVIADAGELAGMEAAIVKFATETWGHIPAEQRRHTDFDDVLQEARLRAWKAVRRYDPAMGTKLSTWIIGTLNLTMREVNAPYTDPRRNKARFGLLVDLDDDRDVMRHPSLVCEDSRLDAIDALDSFQKSYTQLDSAGKQTMLDALGLRFRVRLNGVKDEELSETVVQCKYTRESVVAIKQYALDKALLIAAKHTKAEKDMKLPQIECVTCGNLYPVTEVGKTVDAKTLVCSNCFAARVADPSTCLGKSYNSDAKECISWCPDRIVCKRICTEGTYMGVTAGKDQELDPFDDDSVGEPVDDISMESDDVDLEPVEDDDDDAMHIEGAEAEDDIDPRDLHDDEVDLTDDDDDVFQAPEPKASKTKTQPKAASPSRQKDQTEKVPEKSAKKLVLVKSAKSPAKVASPEKETKTVATKTAATKKPKAPTKGDAKYVAKSAKPAKKSAPAKKVSAKAAKSGDTPKRKMKPFKPQYWTGQSPFRPGTHMGTLFDKARSETGLSVKSLKSYAEKHELALRGLLHNLGKGTSYNGHWSWDFKNDGTKITIKVTKKPDAAYQKAAAA